MSTRQAPTRAQQTAAAEPLGRGALELFRVAGIRIRIDYSWFLIFLLVLWSLSAGYLPQQHPDLSTAAYWSAGVAATLLFFASILVHELAHSLVALHFGISIPAITLFLFGGASHMRQDARSPRQEVLIAGAGPLTSFALALGFYGLHLVTPRGAPALVGATFGYLAWINTALGVFNLLPGFPLDGGRVLRALAWWKTGSLRRATRLASDMGKGLAFGLMALGALQLFGGALLGGLWLVFIGMFLRGMAEAGYRALVVKEALEDVSVAEVMETDVVGIAPDLPLARVIDDYFLEYGYRGFPVVEEGKLLGLLSLRELRDLPPEKRREGRVRDHMRPLDPQLCIAADAPVSEAMERLGSGDPDRLIVMRGETIAGIVTRSGVLRLVELRTALAS